MRKRDTFDVLSSSCAVIFDALAIFSGFALATIIRFFSGWFEVTRGIPENLFHLYFIGSVVATLMFLVVFRSQGLYIRPQTGSFINKIPRIIKAIGISIVISAVFAFSLKNDADFSRLVVGVSFFTISFLVVLERYIIFRIEWNMSRHHDAKNRVLIIGCDPVALHVGKTLKREPMLRSRIVGYVKVSEENCSKEIPQESIKGKLDDIEKILDENEVDQLIVAESGNIGHQKIVDIIMLCEKKLIVFNIVPDLFRILTNSMDVQSLNEIPMLGIGKWPLDYFWNRMLKRAEDIAGSCVGLILFSPVIALFALLVKKESKGPAFYKQERCGEHGQVFHIFKLRTMKVDAEKDTGPVWAVEDDPRRTRVGAFMRRFNIDELPQLWNVFAGDMSLVGPRPERPHFVEQFKEDVSKYMWRHVSKPGITGWAQVNGLRGNTSIEERIKYDLYYLENWSIAFDFKIILRTFFATDNAY